MAKKVNVRDTCGVDRRYAARSSYATSPIIRDIVVREKTEPTYELQMRVNGGLWFKASDFSGFTSAMIGTYQVETRKVQVSGITHAPKIKSGNRKSDPMKYQVHLVRNLASRERGKELWIPLGMYRSLKNAYKKVCSTREHITKQRMNAKVLSNYTIFIEMRASGYIRAFNLTPDYTLNCGEVYQTTRTYSLGGGMPQSTAWFCPKGWLLTPDIKIKKPKKRSKGFDGCTPSFLKRPSLRELRADAPF